MIIEIALGVVLAVIILYSIPVLVAIVVSLGYILFWPLVIIAAGGMLYFFPDPTKFILLYLGCWALFITLGIRLVPWLFNKFPRFKNGLTAWWNLTTGAEPFNRLAILPVRIVVGIPSALALAVFAYALIILFMLSPIWILSLFS